MSSKTRKIGFYQISLPLTEQEDTENQDLQEQSPKELMRVLEFCNNLRDQDRIMKMEKVKKAHHIELIEQDPERNECCIRFIFGKYAHCPQIYNVDTATIKESNKTLRDAEKEQTHLVFRIKGEVIYALLEERRNGITITTIWVWTEWQVQAWMDPKTGFVEKAGQGPESCTRSPWPDSASSTSTRSPGPALTLMPT